ncbi:phage tail tip lysozyme [Acetobacter pasteurianus]|uniref:Phage related tail protein n=1 Tax=Acetobacter pasteurianus (strain NBRC 105184 / IFO 3283-01) TaxID=634452 RepID=C7JFG0_ACEP3|nr:phage tail tip lysozyme [Acetobacter pasteurianus]BAH98981.1 phage related tail protein [Acetobacter pasteurianus IFO 3283-01]BAI02032.1 phage related tail protein [Acetobacter pasteurianus IFO 3283-03]BAI05080.1 phage related tail protein [Acetobacter pasteurianus IFO 3283-07]BAI08127.1 phage related tail protein [Acetobacter pasteurianus IFO 3283-22]BAI11175.1 phage related tail protein [Acetobacter pasteurianus IFO 3283-26]
MAANVIDQLVVMFAIDGRKATSGAKEVEKAIDGLTDAATSGAEASESAAKSTEQAFQRTGQAIRRTGGALQGARRSIEGNNRAIDGSGKSVVETGKKIVKTTDKTDKSMDRSREKNVRNARDVGDSQKELADTLRRTKGEALRVMAILTAGRGMKEFLSSTTATSAAAGRMAHNLGMTTQDLTAWQTVAKESGGTADGMASSLQGIVDQFQTISGQQNLTRVFSSIGVNLKDSNGKLRDRTQIMMDLADRFSNIDPTQANTWGQMLGFDQGTINTLERGRKELSGLYDEARKNAITPEQASAFSQLQQDWVQLTTQSDALGRSILTSLVPPMHAVLKDTSEFIDKYPNLAKGIGITGVGLAGIATTLGSIASVKIGGSLLGVLGRACTCGEGEGIKKDAAKAEGGKAATKEVAKDAAEAGGSVAATGRRKAAAPILRRVGRDALRYGGKALRVAPLAAIAYEILADATPTAKDDTLHASAKGLDTWAAHHNGGGAGVSKVIGEVRASLDRAAIAKSFFEERGWSSEQSEGILANLIRESGLRASASGDGGSAYGIGQWHADRQLDYAKLYGHRMQDVRDRDQALREQLGFVDWELNNTEKGAGNKLRATSTRRGAAAAVSGYYERPADRIGNMTARGDIAESLHQYLPDSQMMQYASAPINNSTSNSQTIHVDAITVNTHGTNPDSVVRAIHHEFGVAATLGHQTATRLG